MSRVLIEGSYTVLADKASVWRGLNDPDALKYCIKNCQSLKQLDHNQFKAVFGIKVGPLKIGISAHLEVNQIQPPERYELSCRVEARLLGSAEGVADVKLLDKTNDTTVSYKAHVDLEGRLASYGEEFVSRAADRRLQLFFQSLQDWLLLDSPVLT